VEWIPAKTGSDNSRTRRAAKARALREFFRYFFPDIPSNFRMNPILAFIDGIGGPELLLLMVVVLMLFGSDKLPGLARGMGKSIREFKKAAAGVEEEIRQALEEAPEKPAPVKLTPPAATVAQQPPETQAPPPSPPPSPLPPAD
jgi:sec-independent protein translocase protein TatA